MEIIRSFIDGFYHDVMPNFREDQVIQVIFRVEYADNSFRSFSRMKKVTTHPKFKEVLFDSIKWYILNNLSYYEQLQVKSIRFNYFISDHTLFHDSHSNLRSFINQLDLKIDFINDSTSNDTFIKEYDFLPKTMFLKDWSPNIKFSVGHKT